MVPGSLPCRLVMLEPLTLLGPSTRPANHAYGAINHAGWSEGGPFLPRLQPGAVWPMVGKGHGESHSANDVGRAAPDCTTGEGLTPGDGAPGDGAPGDGAPAAGSAFAEDDDGVVPSEAHRVGDGHTQIMLAGRVGHIVEVALRVGLLIVDRRRQQTIAQCERRDADLYAPGCADAVAGHGL